MILLRAVPPELVEGVLSGAYKVTGSVVREVSSGRGVAFLQETGVFQSLLGSALKGAGATLEGGFSPLGLIAVVQNQQIKSRLAELQSSLALLQNLQVGTLAVAGVGLGVSVVGFAMVLKRLKGIENHLTAIEGKIDQITKDRRSDDLRMIFSDIAARLSTIETLAARSNKTNVAETAEQELAKSAGRLEVHFQRQAERIHDGTLKPEEIEVLWSLAAAIRLCHEAGLRALFSIDELDAARHLAERRAASYMSLSQGLSPDAIARVLAHGSADYNAYAEARAAALPKVEVFVNGMRDSVTAIATQAELASHLISMGASGPAYLAELEDEKTQPLLLLPT
jgi:hypothetical protein